MKRQPPMATISVGALTDETLQIVEVLDEQCSMTSTEFVDRVALALKYEVRVRILVPALKRRLAFAWPSSGTATLCTTWVTTLPSFFRSLRADPVLMNFGIEGSITIRPAEPS